MSSSDLAALAILPVATWTMIFLALWSTRLLADPLPFWWRGKTKEEASKGAQLWAIVLIVTHIVVATAVVFQARSRGISLIGLFQKSPNSFWLGVQGALVGLAMGGLLPLMRLLLPAPRRFRITVAAALGPSIPLSLVTLLGTTFVYELWRVLCMRTLVVDNYSGAVALLATAVAYGLTFIGEGISTGIAEGFLGAIYAALYLWQGHFLVPFVAHMTFQTELMIFTWAAPPTAIASFNPRIPTAKCPACGVRIDLRTPRSSPSFRCLHCGSNLSVADSRDAVVRWGGIFIMMIISGVGYQAFAVTQGPGESTLWLAYALALPVYVSLLFALPIIFPPKLQCGDPGFISLNLSGGGTRKKSGIAGEEPPEGPAN